jgi:hypothetical protein
VAACAEDTSRAGARNSPAKRSLLMLATLLPRC